MKRMTIDQLALFRINSRQAYMHSLMVKHREAIQVFKPSEWEKRAYAIEHELRGNQSPIEERFDGQVTVMRFGDSVIEIEVVG